MEEAQMPKAESVLDGVATQTPVGSNVCNEAWMAGFAAVNRARRSAGGRYSVGRRTSDSSEHTREP